MNTTLFALVLAACGVTSTNPEERLTSSAPPADKQPPDDEQQGQHFCCQMVNNFTGEGCISINVENINSCANVLYCSGDWMKKDGVVTCG